MKEFHNGVVVAQDNQDGCIEPDGFLLPCPTLRSQTFLFAPSAYP